MHQYEERVRTVLTIGDLFPKIQRLDRSARSPTRSARSSVRATGRPDPLGAVVEPFSRSLGTVVDPLLLVAVRSGMPITPSPEDLCAIEACREAARRYCRGVDRLDAEEMRSAYWPDATDDHGSFVGNAWEFVDHCMTSHRRWRFTMHTIFNHTVELDGPAGARGEVYNLSWLERIDTAEIDLWFGRYLDRYERRGDEWRIIERVCVHEGDRTLPPGTPMGIAADLFRQGDSDRDTPGRPLGP